eukprot:m.27473 g.27473  ORF g.27473 m.27473 type:complete len:163 (+) comp30085_c0_seq1:133-621(+)
MLDDKTERRQGLSLLQSKQHCGKTCYCSNCNNPYGKKNIIGSKTVKKVSRDSKMESSFQSFFSRKPAKEFLRENNYEVTDTWSAEEHHLLVSCLRKSESLAVPATEFASKLFNEVATIVKREKILDDNFNISLKSDKRLSSKIAQVRKQNRIISSIVSKTVH